MIGGTERLLEGKILSVTGAGSGIGRAVALLAARSGAAGLVLGDLSDDALAATGSELAGSGVTVETLTADVAESTTGERLVKRAVSTFGRLDAAVNCAGTVGTQREIVDLTDDDFDHVLRVNLGGVFRCMRSQLAQMYAQGSGAIVNVSSASIYGVHAAVGAYTASKSGVATLSRVAAKEAGPRGVRVNALCPGITETPLSNRSMADGPAGAAAAAAIPLGRLGKPGEIAEAAAWLCSDRSSFTNGTVLVVDGGRVG